MKKAIFSGSFDPMTKGHEKIIIESLKQFNQILVVVGHNPEKKSMFGIPTRIEIIKEFIDREKLNTKVSVESSQGLYLVDFAESRGYDTIIRGIRDQSDRDYETKILLINQEINPQIKTEYIDSPDSLTSITSSSIVKGLVGFLGWERVIRKFVSDKAYTEILKQSKRSSIEMIYQKARGGTSAMTNELGVITKLKNGFFLSNKNDPMFELIMNKHSEPHRYYHNLQHLESLYFNLLRMNQELNLDDRDLQIICYAILFHDIEYNPQRNDNEEISNQLFKQYSGSQLFNIDASPLILATKSHAQAPSNNLIDIFLDLDLSILGSDEMTFKNYEKNIREEYSFVSENIYNQKRNEIMRFLKTPYRTPVGEKLWGENRTKNLSKY